MTEAGNLSFISVKAQHIFNFQVHTYWNAVFRTHYILTFHFALLICISKTENKVKLHGKVPKCCSICWIICPSCAADREVSVQRSKSNQVTSGSKPSLWLAVESPSIEIFQGRGWGDPIRLFLEKMCKHFFFLITNLSMNSYFVLSLWL